MRDKNARRWFWLAMILALIVGLACEGEDGAQTPDRTTRTRTAGSRPRSRPARWPAASTKAYCELWTTG